MVDDRDDTVQELERLRLRVTELEAAAAVSDELRKKLTQAETHAQVFVKHLPISAALLDRDMRYILVSDAWWSNLRVDGNHIIGQNHYDLFPEISEEWKEIHRRCLDGAIEEREEDPFHRADGRVDWLRWVVMPWHTSTGEIGGLFMFTEVITERKRLQNEVEAQAAALRELSTPIVPISDDVLVMPLVGTLSEERSQQIMEQLLGRIVEEQAQTAIIDVTGIPVVDTFAASSLIQMAQAARLLGADVVLTGIRPEVAQALVTQDVDIGSIVTRRDLQSGVAWAMRARR
jgi:rsbT co-antagonist protein RsbR